MLWIGCEPPIITRGSDRMELMAAGVALLGAGFMTVVGYYIARGTE